MHLTSGPLASQRRLIGIDPMYTHYYSECSLLKGATGTRYDCTPMSDDNEILLDGNEALAHAARDLSVALGAGYPGTPSTRILEVFSTLGGNARWSPNEKVALEVGLGVAFGGGRAIVTMKHVGLNVAADPLFTAAYTGVSGGLIVIVADDPGMSYSQNEQDSRHYAIAAGIPMLEPADSQESYDFLVAAMELSERWGTLVLLRMTTRVSHTRTRVCISEKPAPGPSPHFQRDIPSRVMIPGYTHAAHDRLLARLSEIEVWGDHAELNRIIDGDEGLGIITSGVAAYHAMEAAPSATILKLGLVHPLPKALIRRFAASVKRCLVVEEGDCVLADSCRAAGIVVESKPIAACVGELDVARVRQIVAGEASASAPRQGDCPPKPCPGCAYPGVFQTLKELDCIVSGDIGCYTLAALPPHEAIDTTVCMGASIGVGLGLRHVLPPDQACRVVSVIGDSTFIHSGVTGLIEMVYNRPKTGHVVVILDNGTTAMTGLQENPSTGRTLDGQPTTRVVIEDLARAAGVDDVTVIDPQEEPGAFKQLLQDALASDRLSVIVSRRPCLFSRPPPASDSEVTHPQMASGSGM
jgi:indolepyruvate ferredoxin oxidoreductase, alpha subunit